MAEKSRGNKPRKFADGKQLIELYQQFCNYVKYDMEYAIAPTQTEFCRWLEINFTGADRKTIYNYLNTYFPTIKSEYEKILSDTCTQGAMIGKYQPSMTIFALKNWCKWTDKQDVNIGNSDGKAFEVNINVID